MDTGGNRPGRQHRKDTLHGPDSREVGFHIMVTAALVGQETKVAFCVVTARPGAAEMDDRSQVLLLLERRRSLSDCFRDMAVEVSGGQLNCVAWDDSGVETVEPTGVEVVPRPVFDDHMVVDAIAFPFLKRAVGDLEHTHCRRGRLVPLQGIRRDETPPPVGSRHGITGALGLGQGGEQFRCNNGRRMYLKQRAVFSPCLARALGECILHWKEQFRRFVERMICPIDTQQDHEEKDGADSQPHRGWGSADDPQKQAEILPPPMSEVHHRPQWMRMGGARAGAAATGHVGRVTENRYILPGRGYVRMYATVLRNAECVNDVALRSGQAQYGQATVLTSFTVSLDSGRPVCNDSWC